ncbi:hypothetical protein [Pendulispora albinea]|uniref:Uncharacterized protein n=1 Tax=Pendulispora albinea TaxID=2741071 RepID=A0ABZ2LZ79_9BACT
MISIWKRALVVSVAGSSLVVVACGGEDVSLGKGNQGIQSGDRTGNQGGCAPDSCAGQVMECVAPEIAINARCGADPTSNPPGACKLLAECVTIDPGCGPHSCDNMMIACALPQRAVNTHCVPDPYAGTGSSPVGRCMLKTDCVD